MHILPNYFLCMYDYLSGNELIQNILFSLFHLPVYLGFLSPCKNLKGYSILRVVHICLRCYLEIFMLLRRYLCKHSFLNKNNSMFGRSQCYINEQIKIERS